MRPLARAEKFLSVVGLSLVAVLSAELPCAAVEILEMYSDAAGEGFKDQTPLTQDQIDMLSERGNNARTLGEARKKAFEHATSILEGRLTSPGTIRIEAKFIFFEGQQDPNNPGECGRIQGSTTVGFAGPTGYGFHGDRLSVELEDSDPPAQVNPPGLGTGYPYALFEALGYGNLNGPEADARVEFTRCVDFYYGLTEPPPGSNVVDFVQLAIHEIMHGIGFLSVIESDGSYSLINVDLSGTLNGKSFKDVPARIALRTIFDEQLYSETDSDTLVDITDETRRHFAITSETRLLWEGTDGGRNSRSCGVRMAAAIPPSARADDGKPLLHAPAIFVSASSVSHVYSGAGDTMEATTPSTRKMELSLGMLRDLGWQVSGLPSECRPTVVPKDLPPPTLEPEPEPEEKRPPPAAPNQSGGGGGCALASGETADHGQTAPFYLLLGAFAVFAALLRKNRSKAE